MPPGNRSDAGKQLAEPGAEPPGRQSHPVAQGSAFWSRPTKYTELRLIDFFDWKGENNELDS
jgi:hypothetical protein